MWVITHTFPGTDKEGVPVDSVCHEETLLLVTSCMRTGASIDGYDSS
jgi:hypothetical protein